MKKILTVLLLLIMAITVCTSCAKEEVVTDPAETDSNASLEETQEVSKEVANNDFRKKETYEDYVTQTDSETGLPVNTGASYTINMEDSDVDYSEDLSEIGVVANGTYTDKHRFDNGIAFCTFIFHDDGTLTQQTNYGRGEGKEIIAEKEGKYFVKGNHLYVNIPYGEPSSTYYNIHEIENGGESIRSLCNDNSSNLSQEELRLYRE